MRHICLSLIWAAKRLLIPQSGDGFPNKSLPKQTLAWCISALMEKHNGKIAQVHTIRSCSRRPERSLCWKQKRQRPDLLLRPKKTLLLLFCFSHPHLDPRLFSDNGYLAGVELAAANELQCRCEVLKQQSLCRQIYSNWGRQQWNACRTSVWQVLTAADAYWPLTLCVCVTHKLWISFVCVSHFFPDK